jgi:hypothetical protein
VYYIQQLLQEDDDDHCGAAPEDHDNDHDDEHHNDNDEHDEEENVHNEEEEEDMDEEDEVEVRTTVNVHRGSSGGRNGRFLKIFVAALVIAGVVVGVIFGVRAGGGGGKSSSSSSQQGDSAVRNSTVDEIIRYMALSGVSDLIAMTTVGSPQSRAAAWMAEEDEANLPVPTADGEVAYKYTMRYAMVVLYYSTGGDRTWANQLSFMTGADVCDWYGVFNTLNPYRKGAICDQGTGLIVGVGISK